MSTHVVGTAGHVDHGKSTLVKALTGIDPDRLQEEKDRGMTIDLGFAWLRLPGGEEISIVDVPGHERFIKNMLAGVGGIDLALLVVAADEGVMPQTVEHVAILDLLRVRRAVVAVTKLDAVESDWLELVVADVEEYLARTGLAGAPIVAVSALTGQGLPELVATIERALAETPPKADLGRPRVPVDRVFTVAGFGTVVTGTLIGGRLQVGQELEIVPGGQRVRARGLQSHKAKVAEALPGSRVAINLVGVSTDQVARGRVVTAPGWLQPTSAADVELSVLRDAAHPLLHGSTLTFHTGSAEVEARVILLQGDALAPGQQGWGQLRFAETVALVKGDLFVLRTPNATVAGGEIVDARARRHRRRDEGLIESLRVLREGSPDEAALAQLRGRGPLEAAALGERVGLPPAAVRELLAGLVGRGEVLKLGDFYLAPESWQALADATRRALGEYHRAYPLRPGMPREELRSRVGAAARLFPPLLAGLGGEGALVDRDGLVRLIDHRVRLSPEQEARAERLLERLAAAPLTPPSLNELPPEARPDGELLRALAEQGRLVVADEDLAFTADAFADMKARVVAHLRANGKITVADARDLFGSSRKYVLALLELLDRQRVTRRVGDDRVLI
ncbi:MAG TPA: selenocysteine-specific translation elongation factor [Chloroflexota bacterium]